MYIQTQNNIIHLAHMNKVWRSLDVYLNYDYYAMEDGLALLFVFESANIKRDEFDNLVNRNIYLIKKYTNWGTSFSFLKETILTNLIK